MYSWTLLCFISDIFHYFHENRIGIPEGKFIKVFKWGVVICWIIIIIIEDIPKTLRTVDIFQDNEAISYHNTIPLWSALNSEFDMNVNQCMYPRDQSDVVAYCSEVVIGHAYGASKGCFECWYSIQASLCSFADR